MNKTLVLSLLLALPASSQALPTPYIASHPKEGGALIATILILCGAGWWQVKKTEDYYLDKIQEIKEDKKPTQ